MKTELVKVVKVLGEGLLSRMSIENFKGERWCIQRNTISDTDISEMREKWSFMSFDTKYHKHVACEAKIAQLLVEDHHKRMVHKFELKHGLT